MARMARVVVPYYPHHVTQRGNRRQQTFFSEEDHKVYLELLAKAKDMSDIQAPAGPIRLATPSRLPVCDQPGSSGE